MNFLVTFSAVLFSLFCLLIFPFSPLKLSPCLLVNYLAFYSLCQWKALLSSLDERLLKNVQSIYFVVIISAVDVHVWRPVPFSSFVASSNWVLEQVIEFFFMCIYKDIFQLLCVICEFSSCCCREASTLLTSEDTDRSQFLNQVTFFLAFKDSQLSQGKDQDFFAMWEDTSKSPEKLSWGKMTSNAMVLWMLFTVQF